MSGRVRWRETLAPLVLSLVGVADRFYVMPWRGWWLAVAAGQMRTPNPTFSRRSDAKRWLLARAAGLAEVPRRTMHEVADAHRGDDGHADAFEYRVDDGEFATVHACVTPLAYVPHGWRLRRRYGWGLWIYERNRRRR